MIVVGARTVRTENYGGARKPSLATGEPPRIVVVTASGELDPGARLFTDTSVPPLIVAARNAPAANLRRLTEAGAEVVTVGDTSGRDRVTPAALITELEARGWRRVLCEGGPRLFGELIAQDAVDELCLTIAPVLTTGLASRIATGETDDTRALRLASVLAEDDVLFLRYLAQR